MRATKVMTLALLIVVGVSALYAAGAQQPGTKRPTCTARS